MKCKHLCFRTLFFFINCNAYIISHFWIIMFSVFPLKVIVHPKMKMMSSFTRPEVVPNLYECLCSAEHKGRYSEECGKQSSSFFLLWKSMCPKTAWLQTFFKISSFVFGRTKTFIQVWNYMRVSKWWQNLHFWLNYPFKGDNSPKNEISFII